MGTVKEEWERLLWEFTIQFRQTREPERRFHYLHPKQTNFLLISYKPLSQVNWPRLSIPINTKLYWIKIMIMNKNKLRWDQEEELITTE